MKREQKNEILVQNILDKVGGSANVKDAYNCATRLRITVISEEKVAKLDEIKSITNIKGALWSNGELQIIIGPEVPIVTQLFNENVKNNKNADEVKFETKNIRETKQNVSIGRRFLKAVSAIFGPLIPFLVGVGLIMALQQIFIRAHVLHATDSDNQNTFDLIVNVIASTGFKLMGVIAMWSTVRYLKGKPAIAIALGLLMISPLVPEDGIHLLNLGSWDIAIKPFYSTILVFIVMGIIIAYAQRAMDKYFNPVANFLLNPFLSLLIGGLLAFFIMGPIMGIVENVMLKAFNWFMTIPFGIGTLIVGATWQPLVVLGVHNILFFAATTDLTVNGNPSLFLAAAFAAAWAQLGAAIGVALRQHKIVDKVGSTVAALPGIISGPTEAVIYGVNLPKNRPFWTGVIAGAVGGWLIGMFNVTLDNLAGLGGIVGFLAYTDDTVAAVLIDLASFALGIAITWLLWSEVKTEKSLAAKTTRAMNKVEFLNSKFDYQAHEILDTMKQLNKKSRKGITDDDLLKQYEKLSSDISKINSNLSSDLDSFKNGIKNHTVDSSILKNLKTQLKTITTDRQAKLNEIYVALKKDVHDLIGVNKISKKFMMLNVHKENSEHRLQKMLELAEDKNAKLFTKGQKLLEADSAAKQEQGNQLIAQSQKVNYNVERFNKIKENISSYATKIDDSYQKLNEELTKHYQAIEQQVVNIEGIKHKDLAEFKNRYFNDIHSVDINYNKIKAN